MLNINSHITVTCICKYWWHLMSLSYANSKVLVHSFLFFFFLCVCVWATCCNRSAYWDTSYLHIIIWRLIWKNLQNIDLTFSFSNYCDPESFGLIWTHKFIDMSYKHFHVVQKFCVYILHAKKSILI
jgi:hypothetical protein